MKIDWKKGIGKGGLVRLRQFSQAVFLLTFLWLFLQTESKGANELGYPVKIFLDADPLLALTTLLASRSLPPALVLALAVAVATVILGRFFCGWVCPLGTIHHLAGRLNGRRPALLRADAQEGALRKYRWKYVLLLFLFATSLFGVQLAGIFDPLCLLIRSLSLAVYPVIVYGLRMLFDGLYALDLPFVTAGSESVYGLLKKTLLPFSQPYALQAVPLGLLFVAVLALNLVERRFWCKYLCPLGALLGLLSRWSPVGRSVSEGCNGCGACIPDCQGAASPEAGAGWRKTECLLCGNCDDPCPRNAVSFGWIGKAPSASLDLGKRRVAGAILAGAAAVPLLRVTPLSKPETGDPTLIRPPGALAEREFLQRCIRCGECMKVCITGGLQPALFEGGVEGIWSPVLVPRIGYCEYHCTLCGQVCPTGAIENLSLERKAEVKIGLAMIDPGRCLPIAHGLSCIVCEEVCPTSPKAIWFETGPVTARDGRQGLYKQPRVDLEKCVGCGICEAKCPVLGRPAITVTSVGETRSRDNQLLLSGGRSPSMSGNTASPLSRQA